MLWLGDGSNRSRRSNHMYGQIDSFCNWSCVRCAWSRGAPNSLMDLTRKPRANQATLTSVREVSTFWTPQSDVYGDRFWNRFWTDFETNSGAILDKFWYNSGRIWTPILNRFWNQVWTDFESFELNSERILNKVWIDFGINFGSIFV